ncbi:UDP-N-acetylmuramoyl-L-alanyl-D-glutamate--2,6-diaminopimelate ligase [Microbacterium dextranolyticum]|uniref:UDP-N-acetylmuramoyl-L-alanyl-D-glutamate--2, 6-diaminopimelate ligase n=1 Tax=Microbacterium dextranolyticum TaxID=36806 RepID=UPI001957884A|nr:UDP-N-acetylmuramoyl-L-alanyl-D-glutamate--2,6-diaminopimelate ligase [Microbacterium dextranolyticum]MBM7462688.1 UDP-N-acetylmuramoyl-L-alanyl-D-glutamate--2,6-diaminopimelate ligase [Microbacterium dextranolyticum]
MSDPTQNDARPRRETPHGLGEIAREVGASDVRGGAVATGVALSTQTVVPGDLFIALPGARTHGAAYADEAIAHGAVAVLTDTAGAALLPDGVPTVVVADVRPVLGPLAAWFYGFPADTLKTIGITGTQGKTSTSYLVDAALGSRHSGVIGSMGARIDGEPLPSKLTTPESVQFQALLARMGELGAQVVVSEVSSHAIAMHRLDGMVFDVGIFLNLGHDHLDFHGTQQAYRDTKRELFTSRMSRRGLVNIDDQTGRRFHADPELNVESFSIEGRDADWRAIDIDLGPDGSSFTVVGPEGQSARFTTPIPGTFTVSNILSAVAALDRVGHPLEASVAGIARFTGVEGRVQFVPVDADFRVVIDAGHKPEAINALLCALRPSVPGRLITVIGSNGDRDAHKRPLMGRFSAMASDVVIVTDDNPASEDPALIRRAVVRGTRGSSAEVHDVAGRAEAIHVAVDLARAGDMIVIVGKGDERHQIMADGIVPHSDPDEVEWALARRRAAAD